MKIVMFVNIFLFRFWEAIKKWDEALLLMPTDSKVLEMKAQVRKLSFVKSVFCVPFFLFFFFYTLNSVMCNFDKKALSDNASVCVLQALMAVGEVFPAVQTAQQAVSAQPTWWVGHQTLGRAQLNMGEVKLVC
jgi:hypothetical protein